MCGGVSSERQEVLALDGGMGSGTVGFKGSGRPIAGDSGQQAPEEHPPRVDTLEDWKSAGLRICLVAVARMPPGRWPSMSIENRSQASHPGWPDVLR